MEQSTKHSSYSRTLDVFVGSVLVAGSIYAVLWCLAHPDDSLSFAQNYLQLTPGEIRKIPFSALLFTAFWVAMKILIFDPFLQLTEEREASASGAVAKAKKLTRKAEKLEAEFKDQITTVKIAALKEKNQKLDRVKDEARAIISKAEDDAERELLKARSKISSDITRLEVNLADEKESLVDAVVTNLKPKVWEN